MVGYIAKDFDGKIFLYREKPYKGKYQWISRESNSYIRILQSELPNNITPRWSDKEPIEIEVSMLKPEKV